MYWFSTFLNKGMTLAFFHLEGVFARTLTILKNYYKDIACGNSAKFYANSNHVVTMGFVRVNIFNYLIIIIFEKTVSKVS